MHAQFKGLKNVLAACAICGLLLVPARPRVHAAEGDAAPANHRVAVFPFEIHSKDSGDSFLSQAFADTLTSALAQVSALILTERGQLKTLLEEQELGQSGIVDPKTAARTGMVLGAQTAVLGSFTRVGKTGQATCRLVDIATTEVDKSRLVKVSRTLEAEEAMFDLMDELANALAATFDLKPTPREAKQIAARAEPTKTYSAYQFFIQGRSEMILATPEGYERAIPHFLKAVEADPGYALAYAALAENYCHWGSWLAQNGKPYQSQVELCSENAQKALKLRPDLAETHRAMGFAYGAKAHLGDAEKNYGLQMQEARKAIELNPNDAESHYGLWVAKGTPDPDDPLIRRALELNPRFVNALNDYGGALRMNGRGPEAISTYNKILEISPRNITALNNLGYALMMQGDLDKAVDCFKKALEINPEHAKAHINLGGAYRRMGDFQSAGECYQKACDLGQEDGCHNLRLLHRMYGANLRGR